MRYTLEAMFLVEHVYSIIVLARSFARIKELQVLSPHSFSIRHSKREGRLIQRTTRSFELCPLLIHRTKRMNHYLPNASNRNPFNNTSASLTSSSPSALLPPSPTRRHHHQKQSQHASAQSPPPARPTADDTPAPLSPPAQSHPSHCTFDPTPRSRSASARSRSRCARAGR